MKSRFSVCLFASLFSIAAIGCGSENEGSPTVTSAQIDLATVPGGVQCVKVVVTVAGQTVNPPLITVAAGASTASLNLGQLPAGNAIFQGSAYNMACASVTSSTVANWIADSTPATLAVGTVTVVQMNFRLNSPVAVKANFEASVADVYTSIYATYARMGDGTVMQWGATGFSGTYTPTAVPSLTNVASVAGGNSFACAVKTDGSVWCWGYNQYGAMGPNVAIGAFATTPVQIPGLSGITGISAGIFHVCAVSTGGNLYCWGYNADGEFGNGAIGNINATPVFVRSGIGAVSAGGYYTCVLDSFGNVQCAGQNTWGQLGNGTQVNSTTLTLAFAPAIAVAAGQYHTCVIALDNTVRCFGGNLYGNIGDGTYTTRLSPVAVTGLNNVLAIRTGSLHTCALVQGGTVYCWGENSALGSGLVNDQPTPFQVPSLSGVVSLSTNQGNHSCVLLSDGSVKCWGSNPYEQIGDGTSNYAAKPTTVLF